MTGAAIRSRLITLRRDREAALLGRDLLDGKREAILRELVERVRVRNCVRDEVKQAYAAAQDALDEARIELGSCAIDSAALAQPVGASVERSPGSLVGVPLARLRARVAPFRPSYGPGGTAASLDGAGAEFAALIPSLMSLAQEDEAVRNLEAGLRKTVRRLKALENVVIPRLEREAREVAGALEEEERDESLRRKRWLATLGK